MLVACLLIWFNVNESSLKTNDKKQLEIFHETALALSNVTVTIFEHTSPNVASHCFKCICITLHFVGSLSFHSQEADGYPSPQIFPRTKFQLMPEDFVIPEVYHVPFNSAEVYPVY